MNAYDACTSQAFPAPVWNGGPARFQGSALSRHNVDGTPGFRPLAYRPRQSAKTVRLRVRGPASTIHRQTAHAALTEPSPKSSTDKGLEDGRKRRTREGGAG